MNMDYLTEARWQRNLSQQLHETPWWQSLMANEKFRTAYEHNYHVRLLMSDSSYLKKLLRSESERQMFVHDVLHPAPDHLATQENQ